MAIGKAGIWMIIPPTLLIAACSDPEPGNISEDQLNHFTGITEHDHSPATIDNSGSTDTTLDHK